MGSYTKVPKDYPMTIASARNEKAVTTLNDVWFSVPHGSEDFSFKNMRKNMFEEALFKVFSFFIGLIFRKV